MVDQPENEPVIVPLEELNTGVVSSRFSLPGPVKRALVPVGVMAVLTLAAVPSYYFYSEYQHAQMLLKNPTKAAQIELEETVKSVGKVMVLPAKEKPTLATVSDVEKLKNQPFFAQAKNGDKVLIYTDAKKAILYRPEGNKIVEVAPLSITQPDAAVAGASTESASLASGQVTPQPAGVRVVSPSIGPLRIAIYNGTPKTGLAGTLEQILRLKIPTIQVVEKGNAVKSDYETSLVIDVKGNSRSAAEQIASIIGGQVGPLPVGETLPDADFLIIAGQK